MSYRKRTNYKKRSYKTRNMRNNNNSWFWSLIDFDFFGISESIWRRNKSSNNELINPLAVIVIIVVIWLWWLYTNYIAPNLIIIKHYAMMFILIAIVLWLIYLLNRIRKRRIDKFISIQKEEERIISMPSRLLKLENKINSFTPTKYYKLEEPYQIELLGYLKSNYPEIKMEESKNWSRPDLLIDNIAIEIKWPTTMSELKTIPDKIIRYLKTWDYLVIVLFNIEIVSNSKKNIEIYQEWKSDIYRTFESQKDKIFIIER